MNIILIQLLKQEHQKDLEEYLMPYKSESMFICSNLKEAGIEYKGNLFEGEYFGYFINKKIHGVIVHYGNGNVMMHTSNETILQDLTHHFKNYVNRPIAGILGIDPQAEQVINLLSLSEATFSINESESLFECDLNEIKLFNIPSSYQIVSACEISKNILIDWMRAYEIEALNALDNDDLDLRVEQKVLRITAHHCWVLKKDNLPVSLVGFNAYLDDRFQVGPVWTPPKYRNQGFAKFLLNHALYEEKCKGLQKAILFTNNPSAKKIYEKIGFKEIGKYRLTLL